MYRGCIQLHSYRYLNFDKEAINTHWRKDTIFNRWCCSNPIATSRKVKVDPYLLSCTKSTRYSEHERQESKKKICTHQQNKTLSEQDTDSTGTKIRGK